MKLPIKFGRAWLGGLVSGLGLWLAVRQVALDEVLAAFARADYWLVGAAAGCQLLALCAIAARWQQLFRVRPGFMQLLRTLLIAQLANSVLPVRLGVLIRPYLVGKESKMSKTLVFGTVVAEKMFDSLLFVLLFVLLIPFVAPDWFNLAALPVSTGVFCVLFPAMFVVTYQRRWFLQVIRRYMTKIPGAGSFSLEQRLETALEGLSPLQGIGSIVLLWGWSLLIAFLGTLVNYIVIRAFGIQVPLVAAAFLLVALQMGSRVPGLLGGIGVFQYICVVALNFFSVDTNLSLSFGFMLHFVVFVPGSLLGALGLYQLHESLRRLKHVTEE